MKKILLLVPLLVFFSCNTSVSDADFEEWRIFRIGENEGGGPDWQETDSKKTIRFYEDGIVSITEGD